VRPAERASAILGDMPYALLRAYEPARDGSAAGALWDACLGPTWPIDPSAFHRILAGGDHVVAEKGGQLVGLVAARGHADRGGILALLVDPGHRRRGLRRAMHDPALEQLRAAGVRRVRLGPTGHGENFWAGVPTDLPDAGAFFERLGWTSHERVTDVVLDLDGYVTPPAIHAGAAAASVVVAPALPEEAASVVPFVRAHFGGWDEPFAAAFASGEADDVLVARGPGGAIQGAVLIHGPDARWHGPLKWARRLGAGTGAIGAIGVAEAARGNGTGLALLARTTEALKERGLARSYAGGTWLRDWYGKLGYRVWMEYRVSARDL
jgi:GNAT superfamily N-acetyltransferase